MNKLISGIIATTWAGLAAVGKAIGAVGAFLVWIAEGAIGGLRALEDLGQSIVDWIKGLTGARLFLAVFLAGSFLFGSATFLVTAPGTIEQLKTFCYYPWSNPCVEDIVAAGDTYHAQARSAELDGRYEDAMDLYDTMAKDNNPLAAARRVRLYKLGLGVKANDMLAAHSARLAREWGLDDYAAQQPGKAAFEQANLARFGFPTDGGGDASHLYQLAADAGFGEAFAELAALETDEVRKSELLEAAAEAGSAAGRYALFQRVAYENFEPVPGGEERATELLERAAEQGLAEAQLDYAYRVKDSDPEAAAHYFELRFEEGEADAGYQLAMLYLDGEGVPQDEQMAITLAQAAASLGNARASLFLGDRLRDGLGLAQDPSLAFAAYSVAMNEEPRAEFMVALLLYNGEGVEKDIPGSVPHFEQAAEQGYADASTWMGHFYQYGIEVQRDHTKAMEWYETGAAWGSAESARRLAGYLRYDTYSAKDAPRALELLETAVRGNNANARFDLASTLLQGDLGVVDVERALALIEEAEPASGYANYLLSHIFFNREQVQDSSRALQYAREGYRLEHGCAAWMLAWAYLDGQLEGTDATADEMLGALEFAASENVWCALNTLGNLHELGAYVPQDKDKALELYLQAAAAGYDKGAVNAVRLADELGQINPETWASYEDLLVDFAGDKSIIATCMLLEKVWDRNVQPDLIAAAENTRLYGPTVGVDTVEEGNAIVENQEFDSDSVTDIDKPLLDLTPSPEWSDALLSWEAAR